MAHEIATTDASKLTIDDLRQLVRWCGNQNGNWWQPESGDLSSAQILALYHAAHAADYPGLDEWHSDGREAREACLAKWHEIASGEPRSSSKVRVTPFASKFQVSDDRGRLGTIWSNDDRWQWETVDEVRGDTYSRIEAISAITGYDVEGMV
jgi:hypothetical protein